jgi:hypothetical protein
MHVPISIPEPFATPSARFGRRFALLWLVVALLFQGLVVQTHAHAGADRYATATGAVGAIATAVDDRKDGPAAPVCPLCEEKALFGAYLLGGSIAIPVPVAAAYHYTAASLPLLQPRVSSHAWQSRAPPTFTF